MAERDLVSNGEHVCYLEQMAPVGSKGVYWLQVLKMDFV